MCYSVHQFIFPRSMRSRLNRAAAALASRAHRHLKSISDSRRCAKPTPNNYAHLRARRTGEIGQIGLRQSAIRNPQLPNRRISPTPGPLGRPFFAPTPGAKFSPFHAIDRSSCLANLAHLAVQFILVEALNQLFLSQHSGAQPKKCTYCPQLEPFLRRFWRP